MRSSQFKRQSLSLFFIVTLIPALVVAAIWYLNVGLGLSNQLLVNLQSFVLPVIFLGVLPAMILSFVFAELLARPVRRIHAAVLELARGNFDAHFKTHDAGEFREIGDALDFVATKLKETLSEAASETALIEAERNKLRGVLNSMTDGVFALDSAGRIILFNKAAGEITGRTIEEVAGQLAEKVMPFRKNGELVMTRWLAMAAGPNQQVSHWRDLELYRADGTSLFVDVQAVVLPKDPNGISALITFHDLTARAQLEQMKVDFVALAAHELRTPLTEIKGYLDILQHEAKGLSKANHEFLERTITSATQLSGLVNNLLNVARIEHGELNYRPESLDYLDFINHLAEEVQPRFDQQHHQLELKLPVNLPPVHADATGLREVMLNLIENAIAHTPPQTGHVTIVVKRHRNDIETSVIDNGSGIPAGAQSRLFTKFYRVDEMKSATRGTGLGLYICKSIIEAHGGHIWAESSEGQGSTFAFRIPIGQVAEQPKAADNNPKITRGAHGWIKDHSIH
ncbi:MAG TPA: ATP-binding protein [Candidatus Saccharimonadia bacterium]|nr:ATP-binding protein [Candidatus Saccharimonadia bacterium]